MDLPDGDLHRRPHWYPVMPVDALSDREFDWVHTRRIDAQSAEVRVLHAIILAHGWRAAFAGPVPVADPVVNTSRLARSYVWPEPTICAAAIAILLERAWSGSRWASLRYCIAGLYPS